MIRLLGDWERAVRLFGSMRNAENTMKKAKMMGMLKILAYYEGQIKLNLVSGGTLAGKKFRKLSDVTLKIRESKRGKRSIKPLLDLGEMFGNVKAMKPIDENHGFVGIKRGKTHTEGEELADIAEIHEFGAIAKGHEIPPRPFVGPVLKKFKKAAGEAYLKGMEIILNE